MKTVAVIILKDRSTRFPGKNRATIHERPICDFIFSTAKVARFDLVCVSTSSAYFKGVAEDYGLPVLNRPVEFDADDNNVLPPHLAWCAEQTGADIIAELTVCHPFVRPESLDKCLDILRERPDVDSVYTVTAERCQFWFEGQPLNHDPAKYPRTQDCEPVYRECHQYFHRAETLKRLKQRHGPVSVPVGIDSIEALDLDYETDLRILEAVYQSGAVDWV
jgi:CMP-N-acetylneuraminic acid synthetase